jgi:Fanconi anemia group M protein
MLQNRLNRLFARRVITKPPRYASRKDLLAAGEELRNKLEQATEKERGMIYYDIINQALSMTLFHMLELLETQGIHTLKDFVENIEKDRKTKKSYSILVKDPEYLALKSLMDQKPVIHPKITLLGETVKEQITGTPSSRMLIFTQYRSTASHLVDSLSNIDGVKVARFVGQASKYADEGLSQSEQAERLEMLRNGELNILVSTSIGEEGLDIPAVDHVIFYEPIPSAIRYIQRRGRTGRRTSGKVTILAAEDSLDIAYYHSSKRKTEKMKRIVANVNNKLPKIVRRNLRPTPNPITSEDLIQLDDEPLPDRTPTFTIPEYEQKRIEDRKLRKATEKIYMKLLEGGTDGLDREKLKEHLEEDVNVTTLDTALKKLEKNGSITEHGPEKYATSSSLKTYGETHIIKVNKIYRGYASVTVDDDIEAVIYPEEYEGPRKLLKKGSKFNAIAEIYHHQGIRCIWVKEIIHVL